MRKTILYSILAGFCTFAEPVFAGGLSNDLLLSSAWCSFSYNKNSGYSSTTRVTFSRSGTYSLGSKGEGGQSNKYGSYSSQSDSGGAGRWKIVKGELHLSEGNGDLNHVNTALQRNSNGYPIIVADGVEYMQCR